MCNALNAEKRTASIIGSGGKLNEDDAKVLQKAIKDAIREEVDHLRQTGDIVDGRQVYEYWGNIEGRRGLWL